MSPNLQISCNFCIIMLNLGGFLNNSDGELILENSLFYCFN